MALMRCGEGLVLAACVLLALDRGRTADTLAGVAAGLLGLALIMAAVMP